MNILLTISYDGSRYCGWQRQINGITVQQVLEEALENVLQSRITITGASRTDAGVHAIGQRASFNIDSLKIPLDKLCQVVNSYLPTDIVLCHAQEIPITLHPRFHALQKKYRYCILNQKYNNPILRNYSWHISCPLDVEDMRYAAKYFIGNHDFASFCASGGSSKTTIRTIYSLKVVQNETIDIVVCGNGFLYNMVRIIAGTLMYVGCKKIKPSEIEGIISSKNRSLAGKTAPPHGLTLMEVLYDNQY